MNHHERSGDASGGRKTVYPLSLPKRESGGGGVMGGSSTSGSSSLNTNNVLVEDYAPPVLSQSQTTATGSQNPPQSLSIPLQPSMMPTAVAQMKKKSGFQITSVTPAQTSVSNNNSITEDTESCDDLDESHTEDLSSSEILDVSLSRVNNAGGPERSSSEETLNNFHEAETPGAVSPNQPPLHAQTHPHGVMVNGAVHHHHHHHHHQNSQHATSAKPRQAVMGGGGTSIGMPLAVTSASAALTSSTVQKMPSKVVGIVENASVGTVIGTVASGSGLVCSAVSTGKLSTAGMLSSACVPSVGGIGTSTASVNYSAISNHNVNLTQSGMTGVDSLTTMASAGGGQVGTALPGGSAHPPQAQVPPPASTSSRFRVVKLDSTSEPFKKGRWTCTEYYDKEAPENARTVESARQIVPDSATGPDKEGVSVSSYTESHGSGETGGPAVPQQAFHPQDALHLKTNTPVPGSHPQPGVLQTTVGHSSPHLPKLTYAQAAQSPAVTQQQMGFPAQAPPAHVTLPPDFTQAKQIVSLPASTQALPHLPATIPPVVSPLPPGLFQTPTPQLVQASAAGVPPQLIPQVQATQGLPMTHQFSVEAQQGRANQYVPPTTSAPNLQGDLQPIQNGSQEPGVSARPPVMPLEDARLLLLQHPALLIQTKPGESSQSAASRCPDAGVNVLTASASLLKSLPVDGEDDGSSGASVVAIDNKIEQAMDLVKSHLMYAVREEVEVLKEQIKELIERNSQLEQENSLLKNLASPEQLAQFQAQVQSGSPVGPPPAPSAQSSGPSA